MESAGTGFTGSDPTIRRAVGGSSGVGYTDIGSTIKDGQFTSATYAQIVGGTPSGAYNVAMAWRMPTAAELVRGLNTGLVSDVVNISGIGPSDTYALQMSFDPTELSTKWAGTTPYLAELEGGTWTRLTSTLSGNTVTAWAIGPGTFAVVPEPGTIGPAGHEPAGVDRLRLAEAAVGNCTSVGAAVQRPPQQE